MNEDIAVGGFSPSRGGEWLSDGGQVIRLAKLVVTELTNRGETLATCESLTGGLVAGAICAIPGASAVFRGGLVTYVSELKTSLAGVDADWIAQHGVINGETASQMALGAATVCNTDWAVATTGVAGPDPQDGKSPGEVWIAVAFRGKTQITPKNFSGGRNAVRMCSVESALSAFLSALREQNGLISG